METTCPHDNPLPRRPTVAERYAELVVCPGCRGVAAENAALREHIRELEAENARLREQAREAR